MSINPVTSLAVNMFGEPGRHALLLGAGISQPAAVPTAYGVVTALTQRVARAEGENPDHPVEWFLNKFGAKPNYSDLIKQLAPGTAESRDLLRRFFEPSDRDREEGKKVPTRAHVAIAKLAAAGYVPLVVTTNFDRLLEAAMGEVGIAPIIVTSPAMASGVFPLPSRTCTIVKIHGDYLEPYLKNTLDQLSSYDRRLIGLLRRASSEFGLILAGWSAVNDPALCEALRTGDNKRFGTYWLSRSGSLSDEAERVATARQATLVSGMDADELFSELQTKIQALADTDARHPIESGLAVATVKRYLADTTTIRLHDFVMESANEVSTQLKLPQARFAAEAATYKDRLLWYEEQTRPLMSIFGVLGQWSSQQQLRVLSRGLKGLLLSSEEGSGYIPLLALQRYPCLLCIYASGTCAVYSQNWAAFRALFAAEVRLAREYETRLARLTKSREVLLEDLLQPIIKESRPAPGQYFFAVSEYLSMVLRETLTEVIHSGQEYAAAFDEFEYRRSLYQRYSGQSGTSFGTFETGRWMLRYNTQIQDDGSPVMRLQRAMEHEEPEWTEFEAAVRHEGLEKSLVEAKANIDEWARRQYIG